MLNIVRCSLIVTAYGLCSVPTSAQLLTIPQALARAGHSLASGPTIPSGQPPTLDQILKQADAVVEGTVGQPRSYLSADEMDVLTDYPLLEPTFLYGEVVATTARPGTRPPTLVTILGGEITINGLTFTSRHDALPSLVPGTRCVFLLHRAEGKNMLAGNYFGAFAVGSELLPLSRKPGFASELRGAASTASIDSFVARIKQLRP